MKVRHLASAATWLAIAAAGGVGVVTALPAGTPPSGVLTVNTPLLSPLSSGDSSTDFALVIPAEEENKACKEDGVAGYNFGTFFIPSDKDAATIRFSPTAFPSLPNDPNLAVPLFAAGGGPITPQAPGTGTAVVNGTDIVLDFSAAYFGTVTVPGEYTMGFGCFDTRTTNPYEVDDYWQVTMSFVSNGGDGANNFDWTVVDAAPATTTTSTTDPEVSTTTTTDPDASTTTTDPDASTTTTDPDASTTTTDPDASTTTTTFGSVTNTTTGFNSGSGTNSGGFTGTPSSGGGGGGTLAATGSGTPTAVVIGLTVLILGRIAILSARRVKVLPPR